MRLEILKPEILGEFAGLLSGAMRLRYSGGDPALCGLTQ
jgi:hypothetical protein